MSIQGAGPYNLMNPMLSQQRQTAAATPALLGQPVFDVFQIDRTQPLPDGSTIRPLSTASAFTQKLSVGCMESAETIEQRLNMYQQLESVLDPQGRQQLQTLLEQNILTNNASDNHRSTLYQLYAMLTTPRFLGLDNRTIVQETLSILARPYTITQRFAPLSPNIAQQILWVRNHPMFRYSPNPEPPPEKPLSVDDIDIRYSADCVPSSVMYYMAVKKPSQLARQLNELTSPMQAFYQRVRLSEISDQNPAQGLETLRYFDIPHAQTSPGDVTVKVELPVAGMLRAVNDQKHAPGARVAIETVYQSALSYLVSRTYDPATSMRDDIAKVFAAVQQIKTLTDPEKEQLFNALDTTRNPLRRKQAFYQQLAPMVHKVSPQDLRKIQEGFASPDRGLDADEKALLESIIKGNGGVASVNYQITAGKQNPDPGEETQPYLYGYSRTFQQMTNDILQALKMGEFVLIGFTETETDPGHKGAITAGGGGHEITITGAFVDKKGELQFVVADSDDDIPNLVTQSARELIPKIHHAGLPAKLAQQINKEIEQSGGRYYVPDAQDGVYFSPIAVIPELLPADAFGAPPGYEAPPAQPVQTPQKPASNPFAAPQPLVQQPPGTRLQLAA